jgi:hypothetical protein
LRDHFVIAVLVILIHYKKIPENAGFLKAKLLFSENQVLYAKLGG